MQTFFTKLFTEVDEQLQFINAEFELNQKRAEESYLILQRAYNRLQVFISKYKFKSQGEEILYFKILKPKIGAKLIYFLKVYHIETQRPQGSFKSKKRYLMQELDKIHSYFEVNIDFVRYHRSNESCLDHLYFVRDKIDFRRTPETFAMELDRRNSTGYDFKVAKILANDLLQVYLHAELRYLEAIELQDPKQDLPTSKYTWTESKSALIELIYALHEIKALDHGKAEIKDIAELCERLFNIDLGDYYRTYLDLRTRKSGRTKFLDLMREGLNRRMSEQDDRFI